jgi:hypothetical protein
MVEKPKVLDQKPLKIVDPKNKTKEKPLKKLNTPEEFAKMQKNFRLRWEKIFEAANFEVLSKIDSKNKISKLLNNGKRVFDRHGLKVLSIFRDWKASQDQLRNVPRTESVKPEQKSIKPSLPRTKESLISTHPVLETRPSSKYAVLRFDLKPFNPEEREGHLLRLKMFTDKKKKDFVIGVAFPEHFVRKIREDGQISTMHYNTIRDKLVHEVVTIDVKKLINIGRDLCFYPEDLFPALKMYSQQTIIPGQRILYSVDPKVGYSLSTVDQANFVPGTLDDFIALYSSVGGTCGAGVEDPAGHLVAVHIETDDKSNYCSRIKWDSCFQ